MIRRSQLIVAVCLVGSTLPGLTAGEKFPAKGSVTFPKGPLPLLIHYVDGSGTQVNVKLADIAYAEPDLSKSKELQRFATMPCAVGQVVNLPPSPIAARATGADALGIGRFSWIAKGQYTSDGSSWNFVGTLTPVNGTYEFKKQDWGQRQWWAEVATRLGAAFPGTAFKANIVGTADFAVHGTCSLNSAGQAIV